MNIPGLRQLFTPLNYLRIRRKTVKSFYDWWIPLGLTVITITLVGITGWKLDVFGNDGLVKQITELLKMLIGFYIAALAAVSTFPSAVLDQSLRGEPTTLKVKRRGCEITVPLSRRRFLSYLFGYLAFMSLVLFIAGTVATIVVPGLKDILGNSWAVPLKAIGLAIYLFWVYNILVATLLGLHYLSDRIHRPLDGNVANQLSEDNSDNPR